MAETRIIFGPKRTPGSQTCGFRLYERSNDPGDIRHQSVEVRAINKGGGHMQSSIYIPKLAIPDLIAALRKIDAGPLEAQLIEMEEKSENL